MDTKTEDTLRTRRFFVIRLSRSEYSFLLIAHHARCICRVSIKIRAHAQYQSSCCY